jgi:alkanesulfonate monooxygenase SsuD/methylene tetrahydromethanopterin reductase-like flavin-dependent oxidoreductase (luciferase family)
MLRLTAELADDWNVGMALEHEFTELDEAIGVACNAVGRDPRTLSRSSEVLVRTLPADAATPREEREMRGTADELAERLRGYARAGYGHLQVQLRPNRPDAVAAFAPILERLDGTAP